MNKISKYLSLVKFSHTIFAMPFALIAYVYALTSTTISFDLWLLVKILLCMVFARNTAMGFNRWADRDIDAENPRTIDREIPAGKISPRAALTFVIINALAFIITTGFINHLTLALSPVALVVIVGYSQTKRFTAWTHLILGLSLAIAPVGAYIAVTGAFAIAPMVLSLTVLTWVSGFDILYSLQDADHDRDHGLHSVPARYAGKRAVRISRILHLISALSTILFTYLADGGWLFWVGTSLFIVLLVVQQTIFNSDKLDRIAARFGLMNGFSSAIFAMFAILDMLLL